MTRPKMRTVYESLLKPGDKFFRLTLESIEVRGRSRYWWCSCVCGGRNCVRESHLKAGKIRSCGCLVRKHGKEHPRWTGYGDIDGSYFAMIRQQAKIRDYEFSVSKKFLWELFLEQGRKCAMTGLPLTFEIKRDRLLGRQQTASLDRIDSTRGYTEDNVQWVHKIINLMKQSFTQDEFIEMCHLVAKQFPDFQFKEIQKAYSYDAKIEDDEEIDGGDTNQHESIAA